MTIPAYKDVDLALLLELVRANRPLRPSETYMAVARHFPELTESDMALTRADGRTKVYQNVVHWSRDHLRVRGLLAPDQPGVWRSNEAARQALTEDLTSRGATKAAALAFIDEKRLLPDLLGRGWSTALRQRPVDSITQTLAVPQISPEPASVEAENRESRSGDEESVRREIIARLNGMAGYEFEQLVARVLDGAGLRNAQVVGRSGDEGVDILADLYSPFITAKVAVQVKRHNANVGPRDVSYLRDRWSRRADRLLFVTTSDFTPGAREVAADEHDKQVVLINGMQLVNIMFENSLGVRTRPIVRYELEDEFFSG